MHKRHLATFIGLLLLAFAGAAAGQTYPEETPGQLIGIPVYDPESKRYFALERAPREPPYRTMWDNVAALARSQEYKGVRGRLAIIDSLEVHSFLLRTFRPNQYEFVWIGLRYLCNAKKLEWSDGRIFQPGSFQLWDAKWNQDVYTCIEKNNPNDWAPVEYTPEMHSWIVKGNHKGTGWYFIEWPTGQP
jgi:hypothetical protein